MVTPINPAEDQYVVHHDSITNTWRILNMWHDDIAKLGADDEVPDTSDAVQVLTEGAFIELVKAAAKQGVIANMNIGNDCAEYKEELIERNAALEEANVEIRNLKDLLVEYKEKAASSESFLLKQRAMETIFKLTVTADLDTLTR